jgi:hypothetical protein
MTRVWTSTSAAILGIVLAIGQIAWAQEPEDRPLELGGKILFGVADLSEGNVNQGGPSATLDADLAGYWRSPRILQFGIEPAITLGQAVPGTEMGNALTGINGIAIMMQGSSFPLTISYSRSGATSPEQNIVENGVLSGVESSVVTDVLDVNWILRLRHFPLVNLDYRDSSYDAHLPQELGGTDDRNVRNFNAHINYDFRGWGIGGWYRSTQSKTTLPNILSGGTQNESTVTGDMGFAVSKLLPLNSNVTAEANQSSSKVDVSGLGSNTTVRVADASLISQPTKRLSASLQAQYTSNLQDYMVQQALSGAGVTGTSSTSATATPLSALSSNFAVTTISEAAAFRLGRGFSVNGSAGEGRTSFSGSSMRYSIGAAYEYIWSSGLLSVSCNQSDLNTVTAVPNLSATGPTAGAISHFSQAVNADSEALSVVQRLPWQLKLVTSAHVTAGTVTENGTTNPDHDYGGNASLTRPVGGWTLTGSFSLDKNTSDLLLIYNASTAEAVTFNAAYRGMSFSASQQYGHGLALQLGDSIVYLSSPVVSPLLGTPVLSSTTGTTLSGNYRSRRDRLAVAADWARYIDNRNNLLATESNFLNLRASYKLRRLRLIAGYRKQTQSFGVGTLGNYETRLIYFQVERVFRAF